MAQDLADRLVSGIDPDLLACLRTTVNSFVKWDVVHFFHRNPQTVDTSENIALHLGRDVRAIQGALEALAGQEVLVERFLDGMKVYELSDDPSTRGLIRRLVEACDDRLFRAKAVYQVIRAMRGSELAPAVVAGQLISSAGSTD